MDVHTHATMLVSWRMWEKEFSMQHHTTSKFWLISCSLHDGYSSHSSCSYYAPGPTGTLPEFYSVGLLDTFIDVAQLYRDIVDNTMPEVDLWLGETSSMFSGGAPHLSDSYVAGFM